MELYYIFVLIYTPRVSLTVSHTFFEVFNMKKNVLFLAVCVLSSVSALADGPRIEPGPVMELGHEAATVARILLDRQLSKCVEEFQQDDVAIKEVTAQNLAPGRARYRIEGVVLQGGDMAAGRIVLNIDESKKNGFGFAKVKVYSCKVVKK